MRKSVHRAPPLACLETAVGGAGQPGSSDGCARERCGMRPIPVSAGAAATHARPPRARAAARTAGRAASPAARQAAFCRYGFLPPPLTGPRVACVPCQAPGCGKRILTRRVVPFLLSAMAGGAWRGNSAIYVGAFCGNEEGGFRAPFQGPAEDGYRPKQDTRKPDICMDRARSIHTIAAIQRTPVNPRWEISRRRVRGPLYGLE